MGFHIEDYCANFLDCCQRRLGCRVDWRGSDVEFDNRIVHVRALPIGIPYEQFVQMANKAPKVSFPFVIIITFNWPSFTVLIFFL